MLQAQWKISLSSSLITLLALCLFFLAFVTFYILLFPNLLIGLLLIIAAYDLLRLVRFYQGLSLVEKAEEGWFLITPKKELQVKLLPSSFCSAWILLLHLYTPLTNKTIFLIISRDTLEAAEWSRLRKALKFNRNLDLSQHDLSENA